MTSIATQIGEFGEGASILLAAAGRAADRCRALTPSLLALTPDAAVRWQPVAPDVLSRAADCQLLVVSARDEAESLGLAESAVTQAPPCPLRLAFVTDAALALPGGHFYAACETLIRAGSTIVVPEPSADPAPDEAVSHAILALVASLRCPGLLAFDFADLVTLFGADGGAVGQVAARPASAGTIANLRIEPPDLRCLDGAAVAAFAHLLCWRENHRVMMGTLAHPLEQVLPYVRDRDELKYQCSVAASASYAHPAPWVFTRILVRRVLPSENLLALIDALLHPGAEMRR